MADEGKYCYSCNKADFFGFCSVKGEKVDLTDRACGEHSETNAKLREKGEK
jgi:endogenous inhibitor of DNA gyrase (YacG/DUF329 family)